MDTKHEGLTAAERSYLEHAERAQGQGQTLAEYCRQTGLSPHVLYSARRQMKAKGVLWTCPVSVDSFPSSFPEQSLSWFASSNLTW
jgi:hypothetical protein